MVITLDGLSDFTVANFAAVSRLGAAIQIIDQASRRMDQCREAFSRFIAAEPTPWVYNVRER